MRARLLLFLLACLLLAGCVEADEDWTFDPDGGGTYALTLRWDADLWRRVGDVLGAPVMRRIAGRGFPLRLEQWRDGLAGLEGVKVLELDEKPAGGGMRQIAVRLHFRRPEDLLGWEVLARRTLRLERVPPAGAGAHGSPQVRLLMEPLARVPVLDRVAALHAAARQPPPAAAGADVRRDPPPLARMGIGRSAGEMVWRMLAPALGRVRLGVHVTVPAPLQTVSGRPADGGRKAAFSWSFDDLGRAHTDRRVRLTWRLGPGQRLHPVDHQGERDPRRVAAAARPR